MAMKLISSILLSFVLLQGCVDGHLFDITKYGATPNKDISEALLCAWKEAIATPAPSTIVIPKGTWLLNQVKLIGPNVAPIELQVQGILQAPIDPNSLCDPQAEWITINCVSGLTVSGSGVFDGRGQEAWKRNNCAKTKKCRKLPYNLSFNFINNTVIRDVTTKDSKCFHVNLISSNNITFERFTVSAPDESPNTDGIHIGRSSNVKVLDSLIETGDDCISIGDETTKVQVKNVICGPGHGISVGSLGKYDNEKDVKGIYVNNCTFRSTLNGVRIKTWPSSPSTLKVSDVRFENLIMDNVSNPIIIDQEYCPNNQCDKSCPSKIQISNVVVRNVKGTSYTNEAVVFACSSAVPCKNVKVGNIHLTYSGPQGPITTRCANIKPAFSGKQIPPVCKCAPVS